MKTNQILSLLFLLFMGWANAQMDNKFYQPSKEMKTFEYSTPVENFSLPVGDDTITAYIIKPSQKEIKKTFFYFHGAAGNVTTYQEMSKPLVDAGYQLLMVDVRGYGKSTGTPTHLNVQSDSQKLLDVLLERADIKNTKIYIYGASLGTQVAANLAKNNSAKISGLILDSPMSSFTDIAMAYTPQYKDMIEQMLVSPYSAKTDLQHLSTVPKLIIRSNEDEDFFYQQAKVVYDNAMEPKKLLDVKGGHIFGLVKDKEAVLKAIDQL